MSEEQEDAAPAETEKKCSKELNAEVKTYLRDDGVDSEEISKELNAKVKKYLRVEGVDLEVLKDKKLKGQLAVREELYGKFASAAAKAEKWLLPTEGGYLEAEGIEKTRRIRQETIAQNVGISEKIPKITFKTKKIT